MASLKWVLIGSLLATASAFAEDPPVVGVNGNTVTFRATKWTMPGVESATAWFTANGKTFPLFGADIGADGHSEMLSPDKKTLLLDPVIFGMLSLENGEEKLESQQHCTAISMETGCVLADRWATFCVGQWKGNQWVSADGYVLTPALETKSPKDLLKYVSSMEPAQSRADSIESSLNFLSPESYMACHPPAQNVQTYNDLGFYLAEGGKDELALKFYRGVEVVGKRTVLMLNMADSLWRLNKQDEAQRYYREYGEAMAAAGKAQKIPQRVAERAAHEGMKN
ncbi:tetratricopeptide repeat protein [Pseudomonas sp. TH06]|uniref:tetratricopeptide repeat protein n=1 Tax=Pseudomonas sp. TH06 TaxID=2796372 RepID=UPI001912AC3E|nr:tetratricopeptide repeat protein [Pseudomonas sp. TH06]MBK5526745.1 tetratricopeptide repeat protein [Pseudomonas sp. TH06]